jgi:hypothetical protein
MSGENIDIILSAIDTVRETNEKSHEDIRDLIDAKLNQINTTIAANVRETNMAIAGLTDVISTHNSRLKKAEISQEKLKEEFDCFKEGRISIVKELSGHNSIIKNAKKFWWLWIILFFLFLIIGINVYEAGKEKETFNAIKWIIDLII